MQSRLTILLACLTASAFLLPATAQAEPFVLLKKLHGKHTAQNPSDPSIISLGTPGPHRYPEYNTGCYPWYGYGFGVPTYNWGYFGVNYRAFSVSHKGYYGDYKQWGYRRGY